MTYLYCDNRWLYVVISNPHSLSCFFCVGIGISSHGTDDLAHANDLQESHVLLVKADSEAGDVAQLVQCLPSIHETLG